MGLGTVVLFGDRHSGLCNKPDRAMQATGTGTMVLKAQTTVPVPMARYQSPHNYIFIYGV